MSADIKETIDEVVDLVEDAVDFVEDHKEEIKGAVKVIMTFKRMCAEKGTMFALAFLLFELGSRAYETGNNYLALGFTGLAIIILYVREYHKGNRWHRDHVEEKK